MIDKSALNNLINQYVSEQTQVAMRFNTKATMIMVNKVMLVPNFTIRDNLDVIAELTINLELNPEVIGKEVIVEIPDFVTHIHIDDSNIYHKDPYYNLTLKGGNGLVSLERAFIGCSSLRELNLTELNLTKITSISEMSLMNHSLQKVTFGPQIPEHLTSARETFARCTNLKEVNFGDISFAEVPESEIETIFRDIMNVLAGDVAKSTDTKLNNALNKHKNNWIAFLAKYGGNVV